MINGICHLTVIPMRAEPSHRSEMVSQLLFGETYAVMENLGEWVRVRSHLDQYEGWIQGKQYFELSEDAFEDYLRVDKLRLSVPFVASSVRVPKVLTMGALMVTDPARSPFSERAPIPNAENWWPADGVPDIPRVERLELLRKLAHSLLGTPYLWGGRSPLGIDCSGFVQMIYSLVGIQLPRDSSEQVAYGEPLDFVQEARLGDLAFFHNDNGNIIHVGMMLDDSQIIHASGSVRIDRVDETGIFNEKLHRYTHSLRVIVRV